MTKERSEGYYDAETLLYDYKRNERALEQAKADALYSSPKPQDGMPRGSGTSDPTARKAVALNDSAEVQRLTMRLLPVEMMLDFIKHDERIEQIKQIIKLHCWEGKSQEVTGGLVGYSHQHVSRIVDELIDLVDQMNVLAQERLKQEEE